MEEKNKKIKKKPGGWLFGVEGVIENNKKKALEKTHADQTAKNGNFTSNL